MAKFEATNEFRRLHSKLTEAQKTAFKDARTLLNAVIAEHGFNFPKGGPLDLHMYTGFEKPPTVWSMDWAKDGRAIFTVEVDVVVWRFLGTHAQIVRWQRDVGNAAFVYYAVSAGEATGPRDRDTG